MIRSPSTMSRLATVPPGIRFLAPLVPMLLILCVGSTLLWERTGWDGWRRQAWYIPPLVLAVSVPLAVVGYITYHNIKASRETVSLGAVLLPLMAASNTPWDLELLRRTWDDVHAAMNRARDIDWLGIYGRVCRCKIFFMDAFLVTEPQYIKRVLMTDATTYEKGPEFRSQFLDLLGNGVLTSEGDLWKFHRGMTRPFLNKHRYSDLQLFYDHTETLINRLKDRMREGFPADWQDLAHRYTLDTATTFLFGHDFRSLAADLPCPPLHPSRELSSDGKRVHHFFHAFQQAQVQTARRLRYGRFWPLFEFWRNRVREHVNVIESFLEPVIESVVLREKHHPRSAECQDEETLLEYLTRLTDDQRLIKDQTMNLLIGARDTTASTLTSAVYVLTQRPDVCQRLRREVVDMVGHRVPSYDDLHKMKYLRAFINEVLRLYPPVPITIRASTRPTVWPAAGPTEKPVYIPAHTRIYVALLIMHRRKDLWGPDADEFDPDRWLDERLHKYFIPNPSIFLPFHAGPRICLGQQFAYNSLSFVLVRLLQSFSQFELVLYDDDASESSSRSGVEFQTHLTMFVKGALWIKMQEPVEDPI